MRKLPQLNQTSLQRHDEAATTTYVFLRTQNYIRRISPVFVCRMTRNYFMQSNVGLHFKTTHLQQKVYLS